MAKRIFYDNKSNFCCHVIENLKKYDIKNQYNFSSLDGKKAKALFSGNYGFLRRRKSIVFLEGQKVWVKGNAVCRMYWLLGGYHKLLGIFFVIPGFLLNLFYRIGILFHKG